MKKVLLSLAITSAVSCGAYADDMPEDKFYIRGDISAATVKKFKAYAKAPYLLYKDNVTVKPKATAVLDIGAGYYIMENLRGELIYDHPYIGGMKGINNKVSAIHLAEDLKINVQKLQIQYKPTVNALIARISGDIIDLGTGKIFLTGGLGVARIKTSCTAILQFNVLDPDTGIYYDAPNNKQALKSKVQNNLVWTIGAGGTFDVGDGVHLELSYNYKDYGKTKTMKAEDILEVSGVRLSTHNITGGVRFDL